MRDELLNRPLRFCVYGVALAGRQLGIILLTMAYVVLIGLRFLVVVMLRLLRPFIMWPLLLAMVGGVVVAIGFAASGMWDDAMRAGRAALVSAVVFSLYSALVRRIDPEHFDYPVVTWRRH